MVYAIFGESSLLELQYPRPREGVCSTIFLAKVVYFFGESGLLENEPTAPAEQAHTTQRQ